MRLSGKVALVTGGTRGIGRAIVEQFVAEDATVVFTGRDHAAAEDVCASLSAAGARVTFEAADVRDHAELARAVDSVARRYGRLDVMVNNAGASLPGSVLEATDDEFTLLFDTNVRAVLVGIQQSAAIMVGQGGGSIVNVASMAATRVFRGRALYCSSKAAMLQLSKAAALDLAPFGVRVNCVSPGATDTALFRGTRFADDELSENLVNAFARQQLMGRMGTPTDTALGVVYLASDEAGWVTGTNLVIDGGTTA